MNPNSSFYGDELDDVPTPDVPLWVITRTGHGYQWRCGICGAVRGGYGNMERARDGLAEHDYRAGH